MRSQGLTAPRLTDRVTEPRPKGADFHALHYGDTKAAGYANVAVKPVNVSIVS
jgi:hypothetical protein